MLLLARYFFHELKFAFFRLRSRFNVYRLSRKYGCSLSFDLVITGNYANIIIGSGTRINSHSEFRNMGTSSIKIGSNVYCGGYLILLAHTYQIKQNKRSKIMTSSSIIIEDDAWIGSRVFIMPGVTIGKGAIIGAGSVVTSDVPPFQRYAGVPARAI